MAGMHVGIVFRLVAGLLGLALFLLLGSGLAVTSFRPMQRDFADVAARQLPGLVAAGHLAQQSENLVAQAQSLIVSDTSFTRESVALRIADQAAWTGELIDALRDVGVSESDLSRLHGLKDDLVANLGGLAAATQRLASATAVGEALNRQTNSLTDELRQIEETLLVEAASGATHQARADDLALRRTVRLLHAAGHATYEGLISDRAARLAQHRQYFERDLAEVDRLLPTLPPDAMSALQPVRQRLAQLGAAAFAARNDYLAANSTVRGLLARNLVISDKLVGGVANITSAITRDVQETNQAITETTRQRSVILYGVAVLGVLGALTILIYLKRAVLDRLRTLQSCMREQAVPGTLERLCVGDDEIAEMARSLAYYMVAIGKRELALRQSEERYRTLYHRTPVMLHSADAAGRLISVSDYWLDCMGYGRAEVIGRRVISFLTPESRRHALRELTPRLLESGQIKNVELRGRRRNGEEFDALLSAIIEQDEAGRFVQSLTVLTDITDQKRVAAELAARTDELQRSNAELEQFAYVASHDLREPLRMINGYVGLLQRRYADKLDSDAMEFIRFAADGASRMDRLVLELLEFSRVGRMQQPLQPVAIADVVDRVLNDLQFTVAECGGTVVVPDALPVVLADRPQITRVFQNLIGNALKYRAPDRPPRIELNVRRRGGDWQFSVTDNGIGIAREDHDRIFHLFQRLHARGEYEGTGLGLAIAKKIIERHGGSIAVESEPDRGSRFTFTLHAADGVASEAGAAARVPV